MACVVALAGCAWVTRSSVSTGPIPVEANGPSDHPSLSQRARFVAFDSVASNLVPGDTNGVADVFVRDHQLGITPRASMATDGTQANGASRRPAISDDGRYVAFETDATNLFANDTDAKTDVVVRDLQLGTTVVASIDSNGAAITNAADHAAISGNGHVVSFDVETPVQTFCCAAIGPYVRDLVGGTTRLMPNAPLSFISTGPASIADDGSRILYGQVDPQINQFGDAYFGVAVASTGTAAIVSNVASGTLTHQSRGYFTLALSGDGGTAALVLATGSPAVGSLLLHHVGTPGLVTVLASVPAPGAIAVSDDAGVLALELRTASGDRGYAVTDPAGTAPRIVSANGFGDHLAVPLAGTDLSGDGRWIAFASSDPAIVANDANATSDVFVRSVGPSQTGPGGDQPG